MAVTDLFRKFWLQDKLEDVQEQVTLPLSSSLLNYSYYTGNATRIHTVEVYTNESNTLVLVAQDDGDGNLVGESTGILSTATGEDSTIDYTNKTITIFWDSTYFAALTAQPVIKFKYISDDRENHLELVDLLGEVFEEYKAQELDERELFYLPDQIPDHHIDTLAIDHNWTVDRVYTKDGTSAEEEVYLRRQLQYLYDLYKSKRKLDGINFAISVINRTVAFYNLMARKNYYDDYDQYIIFDTVGLFALFEAAAAGTAQETVAATIQSIYDKLYSDAADYFPTKHFLLDQALDVETDAGYLLNDVDIRTLKLYINSIRSETQYPHFQSYLGLEATSADTSQTTGATFTFKITDAERVYYVNDYRTLYTGPDSVESIASFVDGSWLVIPLEMNEESIGYIHNNGLIHNMGLEDMGSYFTSFKVGKGEHAVLTTSLTDLDDPVLSSTKVSLTYDSGYYYITLSLETGEGNDYPITEFGLFTVTGNLAFYGKHPEIYKSSDHRHVYRLKLQIAAP